MGAYSPENTPEQNLAMLAENPYPGRLLVVGFAGQVSILAYAIEGRSEGSRNRRLVLEDKVVSTEIANPDLPVGDPDLTIYDAIRRVDGVHIVSNGNQTDKVVRYLRSGKTFEEAMATTHHEPDKPNFTPRITGFHDLKSGELQPFFGLSVISRDPSDPRNKKSIRKLYTDQSPEIQLTDGLDDTGYCIHTYQGDGSPLPSFDEPPFTILTQEKTEDMAEMLWENLDRDNRVAVVAKAITERGRVAFSRINRHN